MSDYIHKEHPKTVGKTEFWKQIKRTVNGEEVSEKDIAQIVSQIQKHLGLAKTDYLLDFGCGNGALASRIFPSVDRYLGVDFSEYLLGIAKEYFQPSEKIEYYLSDIMSFLDEKFAEVHPQKILIYGVMSYLNKAEAADLFSSLAKKNSLERVFIGNIPNRKFADDFFQQRSVENYDLDDAKSAIGVWWNTEEICDMAKDAGFTPQIFFMSDDFYGSDYRFDLVLEKT